MAFERLFRVGSSGHRKVGRVYSHFEGREMYQYDCTHWTGRESGRKCCHQCCRLAMLRAAGYGDVAARLEANGEARDWLGNWGRMLYDPAQHGRDKGRRDQAAAIIRAMRASSLGYGDASMVGVWAGVMAGR